MASFRGSRRPAREFDMRVLLSAFSCLPGAGSEPGVGWGVVRQAASRHEVWVLTDVHNRPYVDAELQREPMPAVRFVYIRPSWPLGATRLRRSATHLYYAAWQAGALGEARRLHAMVRFDLVHHVTFVNSWMPSLMGRLGIPFLWSAGIRETTPLCHLRHMSWRGRASEAFRNLVVRCFGPVTDACTAGRARFVLASGSREAWRGDLPVIHFPLGGLEEKEIRELVQVPPRRSRTFRVMSVGRLAGLKGLSLAILAFSRLHREHPSTEYVIIGDGPERVLLENIARQQQCGSAVHFKGARSREEVFAELGRADVLLHPSLHEQFGYAALEAMAAGRQVICLGVAGTKHVVSDEGGVLLELGAPGDVVAGIHAALNEMLRDPEERIRRGEQARRWALRQWSWDQVGDRLESLYTAATLPPPATIEGEP